MGTYILEQTIETRIKLAYALANQWFGVYITAASPNDGKLLFLVSVMLKEMDWSDVYV